MNINAQFESLHAKIDRIVAAIDEGDPTLQPGGKVAEKEKAITIYKRRRLARGARRFHHW